ncbi:enoyl-CoA hydratase/isomerase family protein [Xenorhabdus nematophila]|uniref:enoyl-CoA hydratase/isomerase family protein n=1 Tax=Xenorhabdus nematophila TaxID=628 RepID=UPI003D6F0FAE
MIYNTLNHQSNLVGQVITLNRPAQRNSISALLLQELNHVLDRIQKEEKEGIVVLRGAPGIFCSGMDFEEAALK